MTNPRIIFVYPNWQDQWPNAKTISEEELERLHFRFRRGIDIWILQSYVRLRHHLQSLGFDVSIAEDFVKGAICIAHRDDLTGVRNALHECYVVGVRADRPRLRVVALEVVQNGLDRQATSRVIPSWPQPGLVPRSAERASIVRRVAYMGRCNSLPPWYTDGTLRTALAELQVELELRNDRWHDYSDIDVVLAHRCEPGVMLRQKPAAKLVNAWMARAPAILGVEPAYQELGRIQPCGYIEASDLEQTVTAIRTLRDVPELYQALVKVGTQRATQFSLNTVRLRWIQLLVNDAVPGWQEWQHRPASRVHRYGEFISRLAAQEWHNRVFRIRHAYQRRALEQRNRC